MTGVQTCALPICFPVTIYPISSRKPSGRFSSIFIRIFWIISLLLLGSWATYSSGVVNVISIYCLVYFVVKSLFCKYKWISQNTKEYKIQKWETYDNKRFNNWEYLPIFVRYLLHRISETENHQSISIYLFVKDLYF